MGIAHSSYNDNRITQTLLKKLNEARKNGNQCDFTLTTNDGTSVRVHKIVLISVSSFFENMFNSGMRETRQDSLLLDRISGENLNRIIEYMYTGKIQIDQSNLTEVLDNALFLDLKNLVKFCTKTLMAIITKDNFYEMLTYGNTLIADDLSNECLKWMLDNIELVQDSDKLEMLSYDDMKKLISQDTNRDHCCEDNFLSAVLKWIKFDLNKRKIYLKQLIEYLKFDKMTNKYLLSDELLEIAELLNDKDLFIKIFKFSRDNKSSSGSPSNEQLSYSTYTLSQIKSKFGTVKNYVGGYLRYDNTNS